MAIWAITAIYRLHRKGLPTIIATVTATKVVTAVMEVITAEEGAQTRVQEVGILQKEAGNYYLLSIIIIITTVDSISRNE